MNSDEDLFAAWRAGDPAAGDVLIRRHYRSVLRFFEYRTARAADDLVQRTFAGCTEALARYRGDGTFRAFLFGIARNQLLSFQKQIKRSDDFTRLDAPEACHATTGLSTLVSRRDEQRLLLQALVALPEPLQTPLVLFYWDRLRAREIGAILGVTTSAATSRLLRARTALRVQIADLGRQSRARRELESDTDAWLRSLVDID